MSCAYWCILTQIDCHVSANCLHLYIRSKWFADLFQSVWDVLQSIWVEPQMPRNRLPLIRQPVRSLQRVRVLHAQLLSERLVLAAVSNRRHLRNASTVFSHLKCFSMRHRIDSRSVFEAEAVAWTLKVCEVYLNNAPRRFIVILMSVLG